MQLKSTEDKNREYILNNFYYNAQHKRHLLFVYMLLTKKGVILLFCGIPFFSYYGTGLFQCALFVGAYAYLFLKVFDARIGDKETLWVYMKIKEFFGFKSISGEKQIEK